MCILSLREEGGDWDRRNRLRTYEGIYAMAIRDFGTAANCFFETMATFTSTELMDYRTFVKYAVFSCMVAMERSDVKSKVCAHTCTCMSHPCSDSPSLPFALFPPPSPLPIPTLSVLRSSMAQTS